MTSTPIAPVHALPDPPAAPAAGAVPAEPKRQRFTLTRARDLNARVEAIQLRVTTALAELAEVGIVPGIEEQNPVKQQLVAVASDLTAVKEAIEPAVGKAAQILAVLDL